ncbi:uncharacterized protein LOC114525103 [Dendronephthya gigantea]|uniref:uncharacterized protein LOC114525103 n=1 Tax=Dendronephthya gigantea TaxID=151771 RepID=UPI0010696129|nr:uncharacterized protein LOC114525103 [Dendronephthya gigantea]
MGVTIEVYRARIGSHHNFTDCRNSLCRLKGILWNQLLLMFYLNVFCLPYLKSQLNKSQKNSELCLWYVQMVYYNNVYVPLLLRLSNDVEENPGPRTINDIVDPACTIHADFNQGNDLMFGVNAGKQCVAMSLYAIVYKEIKSVNIWDKSILNTILISGNSLYCVISRSINKSYLLLTDVPEFVDIDNHTFNLQYSDSFSGALYLSENSFPYVTLEHALNEVFYSLNYKSCLLTIGMNTVAIMMPFPGVFKVFDSHSRDMYGRPSALHYCVLISVEGIENLGEYFRLTSRCNEANIVPFELKGVKKRVRPDESTQQREAKLAKKRNVKKVRRQNDSAEEKEARLAKNRNAEKLRRQNESAEAKEARLAKIRNAVKVRRQNESAEEKEARLSKNRNYQKVRRQNESAEEKEARLSKNRNYQKVRRQNESAEEKEARLAKNNNAKKATKQNETTEQRNATIAKEKERKRASRKNTCFEKQKKSNESHSVQNIANAENCYLPSEDTLTLVRNFHNSVSTGPLYVCTCCDQLWYKHSVSLADRLRMVNPDITKYLQNIKSVDNIEWLCQTCNNHLTKGKVPPCAIANGMKFPERPSFFDLNELECRLIAPRLAFQKIFQAPRGGQLKITGNVVNVPADVNSTVNVLPRLSDEMGTIKVQLKRRLQYKSSALSMNIRPHKVMQATAWLINTSTLYQDQGIIINQNWLKTWKNEWSEAEAEIPAGVTDSMLTPPDFVSDSETGNL